MTSVRALYASTPSPKRTVKLAIRVLCFAIPGAFISYFIACIGVGTFYAVANPYVPSELIFLRALQFIWVPAALVILGRLAHRVIEWAWEDHYI